MQWSPGERKAMKTMENGPTLMVSRTRSVLSPRTKATEPIQRNRNGSEERPSKRRKVSSPKSSNGPRDGKRGKVETALPSGEKSNGTSPRAKRSPQSRPKRCNTSVDGDSALPQKTPAPQNTEGSLLGGDIMTAEVYPYQEKGLPIDVCASLLAQVDARGYQRAMIRDAHQISRHILEPMSFPWNHRGPPLSRNQAFDLEEMPAILRVDNSLRDPFPNGPVNFGAVDGGRRRPSNHHLHHHHSASHQKNRAATRRSEDPGVIEMNSFCLQPRHSAVDKMLVSSGSQSKQAILDDSLGDEDDIIDQKGEVALRSHERSTEEERKGSEQSRSTLQKKLISVRVRSTSTRRSIIVGTSTQHARPLILHASSSRQFNMLWTKKVRTVGSPQGDVYRSRLSGETFEGGQQRRPQILNVVIRVDGDLLGEHDISGEFEDSLAIGEDCIAGQQSPQCVLDANKLVDYLIENTKSKTFRKRKRADDCEAKTSIATFKELKCTISPPSIDVVPDCNGLLSTICSKPGTISFDGSLNKLLDDKKVTHDCQSPLCTVCWERGVETVDTCIGCHVSAHRSCCRDSWNADISGEKVKWRCASCSETTMIAKRCVCCPYKGGAMSSFKGKEGVNWIHETCRIWRPKAQLLKPFHAMDRSCALCGGPDSHGISALVKCCAARCHVWFHPMCAVVGSKVVKQATESQSKSPCGNLSAGFLLTALRCRSTQALDAKDPGTRSISTVPVAFCSVHNPRNNETDQSRGLTITADKSQSVDPLHIPAPYPVKP